MSFPRQTKTQIITFFLIGFLFFFIKLNSPTWITLLFENQQFDLLNTLAHVESSQSLDYYLGTIHENVVGPLISVLAASCLILLCLWFGIEASFIQFAFLVFIFLLTTKWEALTLPPYGDNLGGPLGEAVWLARNGHDYIKLFHEIPSIDGGPKFYLFSTYPGFIAFWMRILPSASSFLIINHLLVFGATGIIASIFRNIFIKTTDRPYGTYAAALLIMLPLCQAMYDTINMEIPCLLFIALSIHFLCQKRFAWASLMAINAILIKGAGNIAAATVFTASILVFLFDKEYRFKPGPLLWGIASMIFAILKVWLRGKYVHVRDMGHNEVHPFAGIHHILGSTFLLKFFCFGVIILFILLMRELIIKKESLTDTLMKHYIPIIMLTCAFAWMALHANLSVMGPRYKLVVAPFLLYAMIFGVFHLFRQEMIRKFIITASILVAALGSYGMFYPERLESKYYVYGFTERSLEYRNDLYLHMKIAKTMEEDFPGFSIGAPYVTAHAMAFDEYGFVKKPLNTIIYSSPLTYGNVMNFHGVNNLDDPKRTIWVGFKSDLHESVPYPIMKGKDRIIRIVEVGDKKANLFVGGHGLDTIFRYVVMHQLGHGDAFLNKY